MNCTTTKVVIGRMTATKLGISRPVSSRKTTERQPVIDHEFDEAQRLGQPDQRRQARR